MIGASIADFALAIAQIVAGVFFLYVFARLALWLIEMIEKGEY